MTLSSHPREGEAPLRVLLLEPDPAEAARLTEELEAGRRFAVQHAAEIETALGLVDEEDDAYDVALVALTADAGGGSAVERIRMLAPIPVVCLADQPSPAPALDALRRGAHDCLLRSECTTPLLVRSLGHAVEHDRLVSELEGLRRRERFLASHDPLTGLPNRFFFEDRLRRAATRAARRQSNLGVLFLGLDRFRHVNDTIGYSAGDELLVQVAERLGRGLRRDDLVARVGGDEFMVLLDTLPRAQDASAVARKLHDLLKPAFQVEGRECWVTPSIGISIFPRDGTEPAPLVRSSYSAMREVKRQGGGAHGFFSSTMNETARRRMHLETRLRKALDADELELHYQPKVETDTGRIVGAEGLLRWTDPELGVVEPKTVIPVAEETGLISDIGHWSLRTACAQNAQWQEQGFGPLRVSVNLSPRQIAESELHETVVRALWDTGLHPSLLELEITESCLVENGESALRVLEELKRVGVSISLDDFGTGFSSLSYLKRFPVDVLKIDQSFVRDIALDPDDALMVTTIISIAQNLQLGVIAEGVETEEQRTFLSANGCPEFQGFLVSAAVPPKEFTEMLQRQAARDAG